MRTLALSFASLLALGAACTTEEGTTPSCEQNVDPDTGITPSEKGCHQVLACPGDPSAVQCCGQNPPNMVSCDIVLCRYGYGVRNFTALEQSCLDGSGVGGGAGVGGAGGAGGAGGSP